MKELGILFKGEMVRALLEGSKTQTRRLVKRHHYSAEFDRRCPAVGVEKAIEEFGIDGPHLRCPYGPVGRRLWVRETWRRQSFPETITSVRYRSDQPEEGDHYQWIPSLLMPRWASRVTLEVTEVRIEGVKDISPRDAVAEGIQTQTQEHGPMWFLGAKHPVKGTPKVFYRAEQAFESLWDSINGERAPWSSNPWVWAITFRRVEG